MNRWAAAHAASVLIATSLFAQTNETPRSLEPGALRDRLIEETDELLLPLLGECAVQNCTSARMPEVYVVRVHLDGRFRRRLHRAREPIHFVRLLGIAITNPTDAPPAPPEDTWLRWKGSGILQLPSPECADVLPSPIWTDLYWSLFVAGFGSPREASRMKTFFAAVLLTLFALALVSWKLMTRGDGAVLVRCLAVSAALQLAAYGGCYAAGAFSNELVNERRENDILAMILRRPWRPWGRVALQEPSQLRPPDRRRAPSECRHRFRCIHGVAGHSRDHS